MSNPNAPRNIIRPKLLFFLRETLATSVSTRLVREVIGEFIHPPGPSGSGDVEYRDNINDKSPFFMPQRADQSDKYYGGEQ